jgi:uncharacterized membrane protein
MAQFIPHNFPSLFSLPENLKDLQQQFGIIFGIAAQLAALGCKAESMAGTPAFKIGILPFLHGQLPRHLAHGQSMHFHGLENTAGTAAAVGQDGKVALFRQVTFQPIPKAAAGDACRLFAAEHKGQQRFALLLFIQAESFAVFGLPLILLAFHLFTFFVTLSDPKNQNFSDKVLHLIFWIIPVMSVGLSAITYSVAMGKDVRVEAVISVSLGLLFLVIGNYLPKCKQSYTIGIKLPWTLHSEENWNRTHRLAGWLWAIGGFMILIAGFFGVFVLAMAIPLIMALVPIVYSYILHLKGI